MDEAPVTDVFISYHQADAEAVQAFAAALQTHAVSTSCEALQNEPGAISASVRNTISRCKSFIAWRTAHYGQHGALQWEFMSAFAAAARRGEEQQRIVIVECEAGAPSALPASISARCRIESAQAADQDAQSAIAARVAAHVATLSGSLGGGTTATPRWLPYEISGFERFVGRAPELWRIHEFFSAPTRNDDSGLRALQLTGAAGTGKSMLAQEYAARFASAYPGGIFWLDAGCLRCNSASDLQTAREHAWFEFAARLGLPLADRGFAEVAEHLRRFLADQGLPFLWIVDHAPEGCFIDAIRSWLAPHPLGDTLLICRSNEYTQLGPQLQIDALRTEEAQILLTCRKSDSQALLIEAPQLIEQLSPHPLAVDLAGARLQRGSGESLSLHVATPAREAQKLADDLAMVCPGAHRSALAVMLYRGIGHLDSEARICLRISAVLANAPIPLALTTTALAQRTLSSLSQAELAIDELIDAALATRVNDEYFCLSPLVRTAVLSHEPEDELEAARDIAATILASELTQAPVASYDNPYVRWIPHALHITETAAVSNQLVEISAWLSRFEGVGTLRTGNRRALSRLNEGDMEKAQELLDMELLATRRGLGHDHPGTITSVNNLGAVLGMRGDLSGARTMLEHALEVRGKVLGEQHPDTLTPLNNLAAILWSESDLDGAHALFECVVEQRRRWLGETHPETLIAMKNLAVTLRQRGDFSGARTLLEHVVRMRVAALGANHRDTRAAMSSLARTLSEESVLLLARAEAEPVIQTPRSRVDRSAGSLRLTGS